MVALGGRRSFQGNPSLDQVRRPFIFQGRVFTHLRSQLVASPTFS
jgi:hypothetical protein